MTQSTRRSFLTAMGVGAAGAMLGGGRGRAQDEATLPNVVIILADDLGWADVSYHGGPIATPNIDRIAAEGVELDRFYVCPVCSPTRAALMTGRYPIRYGLSRGVIPPWRDFGLDTSEVTLADALAAGGYEHRGIFGKWHLGHRRAKWHPLNRGFTHFHGHYNGAIDYFTHEREGEVDWHLGMEPLAEEGYTTDLIANAASDFIRQNAAGGGMLCYVPFNAPHGPFQAPEAYLAMHGNLTGRKRSLAAMISCLDDGIGRILNAIDDAGPRENTIVWFISDNGGIGGIDDNNLPLRGDKGQVFEGGIRVPACVSWPGVLPAGRKVEAPLSCMDVLPTLLSLAGIDEHGGKLLDGIDISGVLTGDAAAPERDLYTYFGQGGEDDEHLAIITPGWKLIIRGPNLANGVTEEHTRMLFRIAEDPCEESDLAADHPGVVEDLTEKLIAFRRLQPADSVPPYAEGREGFTAPKDWRIEE